MIPRYRFAHPSRWVDLNGRTTETDPGLVVLTLEQAKEHLNVQHSGDNTQISALLEEATRIVEDQGGFVLRVNARFRTTICGWPRSRSYKLPKRPAISVEQVSYWGSDGSQQVLGSSSYRLVGSTIELDAGLDLPGLYDRLDAVWIEYTCGYATAAAANPSLVRALKWQMDITWDDDMEPAVLKSYERSRDSILANIEE